MPDSYTSPSPPAPSATRRRRRRRRRHLLSPFSAARASSPSAMSSSASSPASSGLSLFSFSRSPSPFHHRLRLSPLHASASAVPFAWEHRPGVPKTPTRHYSRRAAAKAAPPPPLPLPPALLSGRSKVGAADVDCFAVVPDDDDGAKEMMRLRGRVRRRQPALAAATLADWLAVLSICQSCTMSRDCLAGTPPPRPRAMAKAGGWSG